MNNKSNHSEVKNLAECKKGTKVKVLRLNAPSTLKQRLISFGIMKESIIEVLEHSPAKSTIEIKVSKMSIALRAQEAQLIEVEEI